MEFGETPNANYFQPAPSEGAHEPELRHVANPAVAAAVKSGSLALPCRWSSFSTWYDWMTFAIASGNASSHGTVAKISLPATA
jgi:hypothetical protein